MRTLTFPYKIYKGIPCPIIPFGIQGPNGWINVEAYVDSGAFISILSLHEATGLGLDYQKGKELFVTVGDGGAIPVYLHILPVRIGSLIFKATIGFSPRLGVGFNLLGRKDIFAHFDITFSDSSKKSIFQPKR